MANEIQLAWLQTAKTLYALVRNSVGDVWQTTSSTFVAYVTANLANYTIALTEQGTASRYYTGTFPAAPAGFYPVAIYQQVGGSPTETDTPAGFGGYDWSGTAVIPLSSLATPTNITAGTITTVTTLTNLPAITADWLTGTGVAASAVTKIQASLATSSAVAAVQTTVNTININTTGLSGVTFPPTVASPTNITVVGAVSGNVGGNVVGTVASVTAPVTIGTNNDKTGYSITGTIQTLDALATHGDANWDTATGFATSTQVSNLSTQVGSPQQAGSSVTLPANPPAGFLVAASYGTAPGWYTDPVGVGVDVQSVNGVGVTGTGTTIDPWGPA